MRRTTTPTSSSYNIVISIITTVDDLTERSVSMLWMGHSDRGTHFFYWHIAYPRLFQHTSTNSPFVCVMRTTRSTQHLAIFIIDTTMATDFVDHKHHLRNTESSSSGSSIDCMDDALSFSFSDHHKIKLEGTTAKSYDDAQILWRVQGVSTMSCQASIHK